MEMHAALRVGGWIVLRSCLLVAVTVIILTPSAANADLRASPARDAGAQQNGTATGSDYNGEDFTRPESKFEARFEGVTSGTTTRTDREVLVHATGWGQSSLPMTGNSGGLPRCRLSAGPLGASRSANSTHGFGVGDAAFQGVLSRADQRPLGLWLRRETCVTDRARTSLGSRQMADHARIQRSVTPFLEDGSDT